jgi:hypothetical protein
VFLDERGSSRWPEGATDGMLAAPGVSANQVHTAGPTNRQQRLIGALNARTGQVDDRDNSLVGRAQVSGIYRHLDQVYSAARHLYVVPGGRIHLVDPPP